MLCACVLSCFSCVQLTVTLWTVACQALLSMGFSRQKYWSGLPYPPPGDLPDPKIKLESPVSPILAGSFFTTEPPRKSPIDMRMIKSKDSAHQKVKACLPQTTPFSAPVSPTILKSLPSLACRPPTHTAPLTGDLPGVGWHTILQRIFPTQGLNLQLLQLLYCRWILSLPLSHEGNPNKY